MTTQQLIKWAVDAQEAREASWFDGPNDSDPHGYRPTIRQASEKTKPVGATDAEADIVTCLNFNCWNEVQNWNAQLNTQVNRAKRKEIRYDKRRSTSSGT